MAKNFLKTIVIQGGGLDAEQTISGEAVAPKVRGVLMIDETQVTSFDELGQALKQLSEGMTKAAADKKFIAPEDGKTVVPFAGDAAGSQGAFTPGYVVTCLERANRIHHNDQLRAITDPLRKKDAKSSTGAKSKNALADLGAVGTLA